MARVRRCRPSRALLVRAGTDLSVVSIAGRPANVAGRPAILTCRDLPADPVDVVEQTYVDGTGLLEDLCRRFVTMELIYPCRPSRLGPRLLL